MSIVLCALMINFLRRIVLLLFYYYYYYIIIIIVMYFIISIRLLKTSTLPYKPREHIYLRTFIRRHTKTHTYLYCGSSLYLQFYCKQYIYNTYIHIH
jgi:hypothetical protein